MASDPVMAPGSELIGVGVSTNRLERVGPRTFVYPPIADTSGAEDGRFPDARRVLNIVVALIGIVVALPIGLVIALLIRLTSPGPVIYTQTRVGMDRRRWGVADRPDPRRRVDWGGRPFKIYKFRTMRWEPGQELQVWARNGDPRITRFGRFLRMSRLDELPQLYNVLKGDMNVVGPRPEQPLIFAELREQIENYTERQRVLPGLTGLAQINLNYDRDLNDVKTKVSYDLEYIHSQSCLTDLTIMLRTFPVVLFLRGGIPKA